MYIDKFEVRNLKSIDHLTWDLDDRRREGWHVILGDNGTGKTTFLRGMCLALLGQRDADYLVADWASYVRDGQEKATSEIVVRWDESLDILATRLNEEDYRAPRSETGAELVDEWSQEQSPLAFYGGLQIKRNLDGFADASDMNSGHPGHLRNLARAREGGWFSAAYGPFRRFTGGDREEEKRLLSRPPVGTHMSVFLEKVSLSQSIEWLIGLHTEQLDKGRPSDLLKDIIKFINQENFLPNGVRFDRVTSKDVLFTDADGVTVAVEDLSDGYRSILCMTIEIIRQLSLAFTQGVIFGKGDEITVAVPGVILIDEVDVHLHPSWQRTVGLWYRKYFPKIQFIVTTHSPLVCQAAEQGTVYVLRGPDSEEESHFVEGADLKRLLYGDILDAYSTELFGANVDRSPQAQLLLDELAKLNILELDRELTKPEKERQKELRRELPTSAYTVSS